MSKNLQINIKASNQPSPEAIAKMHEIFYELMLKSETENLKSKTGEES